MLCLRQQRERDSGATLSCPQMRLPINQPNLQHYRLIPINTKMPMIGPINLSTSIHDALIYCHSPSFRSFLLLDLLYILNMFFCILSQFPRQGMQQTQQQQQTAALVRQLQQQLSSMLRYLHYSVSNSHDTLICFCLICFALQMFSNAHGRILNNINMNPYFLQGCP